MAAEQEYALKQTISELSEALANEKLVKHQLIFMLTERTNKIEELEKQLDELTKPQGED